MPPASSERPGTAATASRNEHARRLFSAIAASYEAPAAILGLGQYGRWRRRAVDALAPAAGALVLDVACGTGLVARDVARRWSARVVGADLTPAMLARARSRGIAVACAGAERLPFGDAEFDAVTFSYLLRYVDDPPATLRELVRVLRPGGRMASIEFGVPPRGAARALWRLYALRIFPVLALAVPGWREVGRFLGPSIASFAERAPAPMQESWWREAGMGDVGTRALSLGGGVIMWGTRDGG